MARRYTSRRTTRRSTGYRQKRARRSAYARNRRSRSFRRRGYRATLLGRNLLSQNRLSTVLKYNTVIGLDPPSSGGLTDVTNVWRFSINSLYDPDYSGVGHQPMYFDNYTQVYQKYKVKYAKITATVINHYVNAVDGGLAYVNNAYKLFLMSDIDTNSDMPTNVEQLLELGGNNVKWRFAGPSLTGMFPKLSLGCAPHKLANLSYRDDTLNSTTTGGPSRPMLFYVGVASSDGTSNPVSIRVDIRITYYVDFYDRLLTQAQN